MKATQAIIMAMLTRMDPQDVAAVASMLAQGLNRGGSHLPLYPFNNGRTDFSLDDGQKLVDGLVMHLSQQMPLVAKQSVMIRSNSPGNKMSGDVKDYANAKAMGDGEIMYVGDPQSYLTVMNMLTDGSLTEFETALITGFAHADDLVIVYDGSKRIKFSFTRAYQSSEMKSFVEVNLVESDVNVLFSAKSGTFVLSKDQGKVNTLNLTDAQQSKQTCLKDLILVAKAQGGGKKLDELTIVIRNGLKKGRSADNLRKLTRAIDFAYGPFDYSGDLDADALKLGLTMGATWVTGGAGASLKPLIDIGVDWTLDNYRKQSDRIIQLGADIRAKTGTAINPVYLALASRALHQDKQRRFQTLSTQTLSAQDSLTTKNFFYIWDAFMIPYIVRLMEAVSLEALSIIFSPANDTRSVFTATMDGFKTWLQTDDVFLRLPYDNYQFPLKLALRIGSYGVWQLAEQCSKRGVDLKATGYDFSVPPSAWTTKSDPKPDDKSKDETKPDDKKEDKKDDVQPIPDNKEEKKEPLPTPNNNTSVQNVEYIILPDGSAVLSAQPTTMKDLYQMGAAINKAQRESKFVTPTHILLPTTGDELFGGPKKKKGGGILGAIGKIAKVITDPKGVVGKIVNLAAVSGIPILSQVASGVKMASNIVNKVTKVVDTIKDKAALANIKLPNGTGLMEAISTTINPGLIGGNVVAPTITPVDTNFDPNWTTSGFKVYNSSSSIMGDWNDSDDYLIKGDSYGDYADDIANKSPYVPSGLKADAVKGIRAGVNFWGFSPEVVTKLASLTEKDMDKVTKL